ncbi:MAG TPA: LL-diaminopimelate aminotransferase [Methanothrix sp.]|nr:LL-diaminopimelate aminotransferase [Methanothrix sp.]HOK57895.1 LL-diaminopimelate aminotransferase [Methanothrix sp.]HOL43298.1 LL-diaminopimelate aminotransferase [Methanothrix sp.]HPO88210.1 LL-diaminopimelate aminotransferase [Methanothrix sp.]
MYADRIKSLPPYLFAEIDGIKRRARERGVDVIDLSVGDPDIPTPEHIVREMCEAVKRPANHQYPSYEGKIEFREAVAEWYRDLFGVDLDPSTEILTLIGSKEGLAHAPLAFVNPGDRVLVPDPAYTVYGTAVMFAGGIPESMPLLKKNSFLPDIRSIRARLEQDPNWRPRLIFLNYPNNPTGAVAGLDFFRELVDLAREYGILVMHDNPYSEIYFDGRPPSILQVPGAKDVAVEFHSLSKTYNMTGWRIGMVSGSSRIIEGIGRVKSNIDSGNFGAVQDAGIAALRSPPEVVDGLRSVYRERIGILYSALCDIGLELSKPNATFYLWAWTGGDSREYAKMLLERTGIVVTPGVGFGEHGEGYIRLSVTQPTERIEMAAERLRNL